MNEHAGDLNGSGKRFALLVARFNGLITDQLLAGARDCLLRHGVDEADVDVYRVPGGWELPQAARKIVSLGRHDGIVVLGCIIRGATPHFDHIAGEASRGLGAVAREAEVPVTFGVLTTDTVEQALERAGTKAGNKGWDAAVAALEMVSLYDEIE